MIEVRNLDLHKERTLGKGISEGTDLGAVAIAKPKPVSPSTWPDRRPTFL